MDPLPVQWKIPPQTRKRRQSLTGPVPSLCIPFMRDGEIDTDGLRRAIDFNIAVGGRTLLLTAGDSHCFALSDTEIAEVTRRVVEHTAGRAMVVAADRHFNNPPGDEFCRVLPGHRCGSAKGRDFVKETTG